MFFISLPYNVSIQDTHLRSSRANQLVATEHTLIGAQPIFRLPVHSRLSPNVTHGESGFIPVGHISLDRIDHDHCPPDLSLADPSLQRPLLTISTLFVLPEYARSGLATYALQACEHLAQQEPFGSLACEAVTLNTVVREPLSNADGRAVRGWVEADGKHVTEWVNEEGKNIWELLGAQRPRKRWNKGAWYERLGFVPFKEIPLHDDEGRFVYYRKELRDQDSVEL